MTNQPKKMGQPTKYTTELADSIIAFIRGGAYIETASVAAGINKSTLYDWLKRSRKGDTPYAGFHDRVEKALAEAELADWGTIGKAARDGAWQAAAWRLERKFPDKYGRKDRHEITGAEGGPIELAPSGALPELTSEQMRIIEGWVVDNHKTIEEGSHDE